MIEKNIVKIFFTGILFFVLFIFPIKSFAQEDIGSFLVLNHKRLQCGGYIPFDNNFLYTLPLNWKYYEIRDQSIGNIAVVTEFDDCKYSELESSETLIQSCCRQLNYDYVSEQVGYISMTERLKHFINNIIDLINENR